MPRRPNGGWKERHLKVYECYPSNRFEHPGSPETDYDERCKTWGENSETGQPTVVRASSGVTCYEIIEQGNSYNPCLQGLQRLCNVTWERIQECKDLLKADSWLDNLGGLPNLVADGANLIRPQTQDFVFRFFKFATSALNLFWRKKLTGGDNETFIVDLMDELRWADECDCGGSNPSCPPRLGGALSSSRVSLSNVRNALPAPVDDRSKAIVCSDHWVIDRYRGGQVTIEEIIEIESSSNEFFGEDDIFEHGPDYAALL